MSIKDSISHYLQYKNHPIKRKELLFELRLIFPDITDRQMRKEIEEMIIKDGYCISSSEKGYQFIKNRQQLEDAKKYLFSKCEAIAIRKNCLERNFREIKTEEFQSTLF